MVNGWERSAEAWIADMGETGDFSRQHVLDEPMRRRAAAAGPGRALDIGCGEGRFCRMMAEARMLTTGLEPVEKLRAAAQERHPGGTYVDGTAEALPFADDSFDLVVSYLTLIDIEDLDRAYAEMVRVLVPGGRLLLANLSSFATALPKDRDDGWLTQSEEHVFACDDYHDPRAFWIGWRGIRVRNFHRPMQAYMAPLLAAGMKLTQFEEPQPTGGPVRQQRLYRRAPLFVIMEWQKPLMA